MVYVTHLTAVFHALSRVSGHSFLNLSLCRRKSSGPCTSRSLFRPESVILLVCSLYIDATEAVKLLAALSATFPQLICIVEKINSEARNLWMFQQVPTITGSVVIHYVVGDFSPGRQTSDSYTFQRTTLSRTSRFSQENMSGICGTEIQIQPFLHWTPLNCTIPQWMHSIRITHQYGQKYGTVQICASLQE
jgi:hypothetical protein